MKNKHRIRIIIFLIVLIIPLFKLNTSINYASPIDNKFLQEFPDIGEGYSEFLSQLNTYLTERFGGRSRLIKLNLELNDKLFGIMEHPSYEYGEDGYVFFRVSKNQEDFEFLDAFTDYLLEIQKYCESRDIPFLYLLNPSKSSVYKKYLPKGYQDENTRLTFLQNALKEKGIHYVDNTPYFIELSREYQIFNREYDAGHWNALGAFYGVNHLIEEMHKYNPGIEVNDFTDFDITMEVRDSLPVSNFPIEEDVPAIYEKTPSFEPIDVGLEDEIKISNSYRGYYRLQSSADNDINLLIFHGSYFNGYGFPYLARAVKVYQNIHNYENLLNFEYYYNIFRPNFVVVTTAEYATSANYFDIDELKSKTLNPPLEKSTFQKSGESIEVADIISETYLTSIVLNISDAEYGYLTVEDEVYDLIFDEEAMMWYVSTLNKNIDLSNIKAYLVLESGKKLIFDLE